MILAYMSMRFKREPIALLLVGVSFMMLSLWVLELASLRVLFMMYAIHGLGLSIVGIKETL